MGVPAFFKWLTLRYPYVVVDAKEDAEVGIDLNKILKENYIENSLPHIDNLYFDMNGIIHPCSHPETRDSPKSLQEMFNAIFDYVDKIVRIIKPKKLIYLAIDGVAPRAKMNQQRSRRFRSALDSMERKAQANQLEKEWKAKGLGDLAQEEKTFEFDSNTITPGTDFLYTLSQALTTYIKSRLNNNTLWKDLTIIFSDANVPGEGEHKILDFIRTQRTYDNYNPNTSHCIYGADADLIMLSLIIHEPHFYILRESLNKKMFQKCEVCGKNGHTEENCRKLNRGYVAETIEEISAYNREEINKIEFSLIKIPIVREYLEIEFKNLNLPFQYDFERIIDDFVFICFLVGNDFLPHLPSLKIREGAIDALIYLYKKIMPTMDGYLTNGRGQLNLQRCEILFKNLALVEDRFFKQEVVNKINEENYRKKNLNNNANNDDGKKQSLLQQFNSLNKEKNKDEIQLDLVEVTSNLMEREKDDKNDFSIENIRRCGKEKFNQLLKEKMRERSEKAVTDYKDEVRFGEEGWKDRYYMEKFKMSPQSKDLQNLKEKIRRAYIEGICWVFEYYYNGCASWSWFYPFHYAPFASDLVGIANYEVKFDLGQPFQPFEQLLSVLPPYSAKALPKCLSELMKNPFSEIADFYPSRIKLDINGQPYEWMGVNLIPFIDEKRIKKVVKEFRDKRAFTQKELEKNKHGDNLLISGNKHSIEYVNGMFSASDHDTYMRKVSENDVMDGLLIGNVNRDITKCFIFKKKPDVKRHRSQLLQGIKLDEKKILIDNLDFYPKTKFKGKVAINIVREVLGFVDEEDVEHHIRSEYFDAYSYNNNRAIEYNPEELALLKKKRYQEGVRDMINAREASNAKYRESLNQETSKSKSKSKSKSEKSQKKFQNDPKGLSVYRDVNVPNPYSNTFPYMNNIMQIQMMIQKAKNDRINKINADVNMNGPIIINEFQSTQVQPQEHPKEINETGQRKEGFQMNNALNPQNASKKATFNTLGGILTNLINNSKLKNK